MNIDPLLIELLKGIVFAISTWAALKIEISRAHFTAQAAKESADQCHSRLDSHLEKGH